MRSILLSAVVLTVAGCGQSGTQPASPIAESSAAAHKAADQFTELAGDSAHSGQVPRQTDPAAGPLLAAVFDTRSLAGVTPSFAELDQVNDWLSSANRVGQIYILAGAGVTDVTKATAANQDQVNRNTVSYAPEVGRYMDADLALMAAEARVVTKDLADNPSSASNPAQAKGLGEIRAGVTTTVTGVLTTLETNGLTDDWREARVKALIAVAPDLARLLPATSTQALSATAQQVAADSSDAALKSELANFEELISKRS
jgi:hypothetical protein